MNMSAVVLTGALAGALASTPVAAQGTNPVTTPPKSGRLGQLRLPPVEQRTLANGMKLWVVEHHELPLADFILLIGSGTETDPTDKPGTAAIAADMLDEGTTTRSALQIADQAAYLGVNLSTGASWDAARVSLHTPTAQLDSALALFADVALHPAYAPNELERIRTDRLTSLRQLKDNGPAIADRAFPAVIYSAKHPYGRPASGTEASVSSITRDDLVRYYGTYYRPNNATLIVVGDVTPADIERRVQQLFGSWARGDVPATKFPMAPAANTTTIALVDKPGSAQSSFRIGTVGVPRSSRDYFPILVMNTALGGSFTSRLNQNLRENKGYTYGAGSSFAMRREAGPFAARAEIVTAKSDSALLEFFNELRTIRQSMPVAELEKTKKYLQLQLPGDFESTSDIAQQLVPLALYGLPLNYYDTYSRRIDAVTQGEVKRVADRYIDPKHLAVVIVGDAKVIEPGLKATKIGPVERRDLNGEKVLQ